jgi:hypothetical protein
MTAILDFGSTKTLVNRASLGILGVECRSLCGRWLEKSAMGADAAPMSVAELEIRGFQISDMFFSSRSVYVMDLPVFETLVHRGEPIMLLGLDVFENRIIGADFDNNCIYISCT